MRTTTLLPITIGPGLLHTYPTFFFYFCLSLFQTRSASHDSSPINVGNCLYSSSNQHFNMYSSCLQELCVQPSLYGLYISPKLLPMACLTSTILSVWNPKIRPVIVRGPHRPWFHLVDRFHYQILIKYLLDQSF